MCFFNDFKAKEADNELWQILSKREKNIQQVASNGDVYIVHEREQQNDATFHSDVMFENRILKKNNILFSAENLSQQTNHFSQLFHFSNLPFQLGFEQTKVFHLNSKWIWAHRWVIICKKSLVNYCKQTEKTWKITTQTNHFFAKFLWCIHIFIIIFLQ